MTWGIKLPTSYGVSFPQGVFTEHQLKAEHHFNVVMTEAERDDVPGGVQKLLSNASVKFRGGGSYVEEFERPSEFKTQKTLNKLGSLILLIDGLLAVDEELKGVIEEFEPGVHQFWPIKITMPKGVAFPKSYFSMVIQNHCAAFSREASNPEVWEEIAPGHQLSRLKSKRNPRISELAISLAAVGDAHIWHDHTILQPHLFLSDALVDAITSNNLLLPKDIYKMIDI